MKTQQILYINSVYSWRKKRTKTKMSTIFFVAMSMAIRDSHPGAERGFYNPMRLFCCPFTKSKKVRYLSSVSQRKNETNLKLHRGDMKLLWYTFSIHSVFTPPIQCGFRIISIFLDAWITRKWISWKLPNQICPLNFVGFSLAMVKPRLFPDKFRLAHATVFASFSIQLRHISID